MSPRGRHYGYGLIQSTTELRKELLWQHTRGLGKSIADLEGQLSYIKEEFELMYPSILRQLQVIRSVEEAAVLVLKKYEAPAGADAMRTTRIGYARYYYDAYKDYKAGKKEEEKTMGAVEQLLAVAAEELDYLEKRSGNYLDEKTRNTGSGNFTKYWRDLKPSFQGQAWCDAFVDWCFRQAFGADLARKLLCGGYLIFYTHDSANAFKRANRWHRTPAVGDQIFFKNSQRICHTDIVIGVTGDRVITIEGNTSGASGVVANGGGVCKKSYDLNHPRIAGYGRPDWSPVEVMSDHEKNVLKGQRAINKWLDFGIEEDGQYGPETNKAAIKMMKRAMELDYGIKLGTHGIWGRNAEEQLQDHTVRKGETQWLVTALEILFYLRGMDPGGVEFPGEFGEGLETCVRKYRKRKGWPDTDKAGAGTFRSLLKLNYGK